MTHPADRSEIAEKRAYYQRPEVVARYDAWRFGSAGGRYVDEVERATVLELLAGAARSEPILDLPCGTGRLLTTLTTAGFTRVTGADASPAMLEAARAAAPGAELARQDALATTFADGAFGAAVSLRFLFHLADPSALLAELRRVLRPGGLLVFDSIRWTPRGLVPPLDRRLGGRIWPHREPALAPVLEANGLEIVRTVSVLVLPSLAYRFLPGPLVRAVALLERRVPAAACTKVFFLARRIR